jgi:hypothetical protein
MVSSKSFGSVLLSLLLADAVAGARIDIAKNKGFHPNLRNSLTKRGPAPAARAAPENYQYYNEGSKRECEKAAKPCARLTTPVSILRRVSARHPARVHDRNVQWSHAN